MIDYLSEWDSKNIASFPLIECSNPVVFFINGIGDAFMALPALRAITKLLMNRVTLICQPEHICFDELPLRAKEYVNIIDYTADGPYFDIDQVINKISQCDILFLLINWKSKLTTALIQNIKPKLTIGVFEEYNIALPVDHSKHTIDQLFEFAKLIDKEISIGDFIQPPVFTQDILSHANIIKQHLAGSKKMLAIQVETKKNKMWSLKKFNILINQFLDENPDFVVIVVGEQYLPVDKGKHNKSIIFLFGVSLAFACALVSLADLFLGIDSCMLHVADLFRIPTVGLFGPTNHQRFGCRFAPHKHIDGQGSMSNISLNDVLNATRQIIPLINK